VGNSFFVASTFNFKKEFPSLIKIWHMKQLSVVYMSTCLLPRNKIGFPV
jgi:hypothetical protein